MAIFAAVLFAVGLATLLVLGRIGVTDRLVRAIGPILTLLGLIVFGFGARNADLASFVAARRNAPPFYGGLALAALAAGIALCLDPGLTSFSDPPPLGAAAGMALGSIAIGPLLRRFGATSLNDVVATRFSGSPAAVVSAIAAWTVAALTTLAGFEIAVAAAETLVTPNRLWAEAIVATAVVLSVAPGGLAGVIWSAAASAGELAMIVGLGLGVGLDAGVAPPSVRSPRSSSPSHSPLRCRLPRSSPPPLRWLVSRPAVAGAREPGRRLGGARRARRIRHLPGVGRDGESRAFRISGRCRPARPGPGRRLAHRRRDAGLRRWRSPALAFTASSRAFGVALADPPKPFPTPASVRLARMRAAQLAVVVGCAVCDSKGLIDARAALIVAMALSLALTTPIVALARDPARRTAFGKRRDPAPRSRSSPSPRSR